MHHDNGARAQLWINHAHHLVDVVGRPFQWWWTNNLDLVTIALAHAAHSGLGVSQAQRLVIAQGGQHHGMELTFGEQDGCH